MKEPQIRKPRELSKAAPVLRVADKQILSGTRLVPMDKVVTPPEPKPDAAAKTVGAPTANAPANTSAPAAAK